jgi:hypothetical protein
MAVRGHDGVRATEYAAYLGVKAVQSVELF